MWSVCLISCINIITFSGWFVSINLVGDEVEEFIVYIEA
jgi:hypothetical protein